MIPFGLNPLGVNKTTEISDLDILKQIRDANPSSQLPALWLDSEDPYTQWEGVTWLGNKVIELNVAYKSLTILQNINKLTSLTYLNCNGNQLTSLDVTGLTLLTNFECSNNLLTSLNVSGLTSLQFLHCFLNKLTSLDVTGLISLIILECRSNELTSLNVSELTLLEELGCNFNKLISLDVTGLTLLTSLYCSSNQLTSIPTLISRQNISVGNANFDDNKLGTTEVNRLLGIGFTAQEIGTQNT